MERDSPDLNYETRMRSLRTALATDTRALRISGSIWPAYELIMLVFGWVCVGVAFLLAEGYAMGVCAGAGVVWLGFSVWTTRRVRLAVSGKLEARLVEAWSALYGEETQTSAPA